jgi:hypothetical protein
MIPWGIAAFIGSSQSFLWLGLGALVSVGVLYACVAITFEDSAASNVEESIEISEVKVALLPTPISEAQKLAVLSRLQHSIVRLNQSRQEAEMSVIKLVESAKRMDQLRKAQLEFFTTQIAPRLSKNGSVPETLKALDAQQHAEIQRMAVFLQFHDAWEQSLSKIEKEELRVAIGLLEPSILQPGQTEQGPTGATLTTVTPIRRNQVEALQE